MRANKNIYPVVSTGEYWAIPNTLITVLLFPYQHVMDRQRDRHLAISVLCVCDMSHGNYRITYKLSYTVDASELINAKFRRNAFLERFKRGRWTFRRANLKFLSLYHRPHTILYYSVVITSLLHATSM